MTGQYCHKNGVRVNGDILTPDKGTIAHAFRDAGYRTSYVGKWHLAGVNGAGNFWAGEDFWVHPSLRGGFEDWFGFDQSTNYAKTLYSQGEFIFPPGILEGYQTDSLTDLSLTYLNETAKDLDYPWFHVISYETPHAGVRDGSKVTMRDWTKPPREDEYWGYGHPAPEEYEKLFSADDLILCDDVPVEMEKSVRKKLAGYYAMVKCLDDNVGRLLDWLDDNNLAEDTLVLFFSDHGEQAGSHGKSGKSDLYNKSIKLPFLLRLPGCIPSGKTSDEFISGVDISPSFAGLCDVPMPPDVQGMNLSGVLQDREGQRRSEVYFQWMGQSRYYWGDFKYRGVKTERYTYCCATDETMCLLIDDLEDPGQMNNLYDDHESRDIQLGLLDRLCDAILSAGENIPDYVLEQQKLNMN